MSTFTPGESRTRIHKDPLNGFRFQPQYFSAEMQIWCDLGDARETEAEARASMQSFGAIPLSSIYRTWKERIDSGVIRTSLVRQFAAAVVPLAHGLRAGGFHTNLSRHEAELLLDQLRTRHGVRLPDDDEAKGFGWLERNGKRSVGLPDAAIDLFDHFSYQGDAWNYGSGAWPHHVPVWRIHLTDGRAIDYANVPWQARAYDGTSDPYGWSWVQ